MPKVPKRGPGVLVLLLSVILPVRGQGLSSAAGAAESTVLRGIVESSSGTVDGAVVRVQATGHSTVTDARGRFALRLYGREKGPFRLTAWAPGFYCAGPVEVNAGQTGIRLRLEAHPAEDRPDYAWLPSLPGSGGSKAQPCADCHSRTGTGLPFTLPVDEWQQDAHSRSALNPRFLSFYAGTDLHGRQSPPTRYAVNPDYGRFPLAFRGPEPDYGPGYKLDFPGTAGNCASCHAPAASVAAPFDTDPRTVAGDAEREGIPCDFCHKVWGVRLNPETGLPGENLTGIHSFEFRRPPAGRSLFIGPYDDVAPGHDTYSPLQRQSAFCAPCHFAVFWNTVVYGSFGEWLASPYSDPKSGRTCQDCHMPPLGANRFARPDKGGLVRDPATIFSHRMPGAADAQLLTHAVSLRARARREAGTVVVEVTITNDRTGHHVPTDSPLRHMILLVRAVGNRGGNLPQISGSKLPEWCGEGDPERGYYSGLPGKVFAKVLEELWTGVYPSAAYWNPIRILSDNRLAAFASDASSYSFSAPDGEGVRIEVSLLFRRAFIRLMDQKAWNTPDILMERETLSLRSGHAQGKRGT